MAGSVNAPVISEARLDFSCLLKGERCGPAVLWLVCWYITEVERPMSDACEDTGTLLPWATCSRRAPRRRDLRGLRISSWNPREALPTARPKCLRGTPPEARPATPLCSSGGWWWTAASLCRDASLWLTLPGRIWVVWTQCLSWCGSPQLWSYLKAWLQKDTQLHRSLVAQGSA